jgi:hypothetical protein
MKITKDSTLAEILELKGAEKILAKYNLPCLTCPLASMEMDATHPPPRLKIGQICKLYGINIRNLLEDLNKRGT